MIIFDDQGIKHKENNSSEKPFFSPESNFNVLLEK